MTSAATRLAELLLVPAAGYVLICILVSLFQRGLIYLPARWTEDEARRANSAYEAVRFQTSDGETLHGWLRRRAEAPWTVIVFHGNAGNLSVQAGLMDVFVALDLQVLLFDYRGYGLSTGRPSEEGLIRDGEAAARFVERELDVSRQRIVYYGKSLGTGVAVLTAARRLPGRLILESAFDSLATVGRYHYPYLPVRLALRDRFDAAAVIGQVRCPILFLHPGEDEIVPLAAGRALFEKAREPKQFVAIAGARHNEGLGSITSRYGDAIRRFLGLESPRP